MAEMRVHVVKLWGDFGHFRRIYTTTTPLTFPIPPRPTLIGIIGAMLGLSREKYMELLSPEQLDVTLQVINPIVTTRMRIKLMSPKKAVTESRNITVTESRNITKTHRLTIHLWHIIREHQLTNFEFVKNPGYKVFLHFKDLNIEKRFMDLVPAQKSVYNPSFGLSELLASFTYLGQYPLDVLELSSDEKVRMDSTVPLTIGKVSPEPKYHYITERMPRVLSKDRRILQFQDLVMEARGKPISVIPKHDAQIWRIDDLDVNISFM